MSGNLSEWTWDTFDPSKKEYPDLEVDPYGYTKEEVNVFRVVKGFNIESNCRNPCDGRCPEPCACWACRDSCALVRCGITELEIAKHYEYSNVIGFRLVRRAE